MSKPIIICVDDEKSVLNTLEEQLQSKLEEEFDIELAISGDEALELMQELNEDGVKVAAVISDQIMPGMKGDELLIEIHRNNPDIPKILLTGQASLGAIQNAINNAGLYRYISKPWEMNDLVMTVLAAAKSYLQKQTIDTYGQSIKLLKNINTATRKLSSEIGIKELGGKYLSMVAEHTGIDSCYIIFDRNREVVTDAYDVDGEDMVTIHKLIKNDNQGLLKKIKKEMPNYQGYVGSMDRILLPLSSREEKYGYVFVKNKNDRAIGESEFEMFKILTKQLLVSYETAKLYQNIASQKKVIEYKNKSIQSSLDYAQKIQESLLPDISDFQKTFPDSFIWYEPKDTVSGDFYATREIGDNIFIIAADCTGHGVPGAFITILGRMILRELVLVKEIMKPSQILEGLDKRIINLFHRKGESEIRDGMDISIVVYNKPSKKFYFSGAKSTIYTISNGEINRIKGDKYEIGNYMFKDVENKYNSVELDISSGDSLYMMSDGVQDQFGGENFSKVGLRKLQELLTQSHELPMDQQKDNLEKFLKEWMGENSQTDDISMIGFRVP